MKLFSIICIIILAILVAVIIFLSKLKSNLTKQTSQVSWFDKCEELIYKLLINENCKIYEHDLNNVLEAIKYSDKFSKEYRRDNEIYDKINKIYEMVDYFNDEKEIRNELSQILLLIKQRNDIVSKSKRGSF